MSMSIGIPPNSVGRGGLSRMEGRAARERQSIGSEVNQGRAECIGVKVIEQSVDWKASFTNHTWSILQAAAYQASGLVSIDGSKGIVAI